MSADNKNNSSNFAINTYAESIDISVQKIIDMTNRFYLDMTKNILSDNEYDIMKKILIGKYTLQSIAAEYGLTEQRITYIYKKASFKVKSVSELVKEINALKEKRNQLYKTYLSEYKELTKGRKKNTVFDFDKKISESCFPFSKRLWNMLCLLEVYTYRDLFEDTLDTYPKYRGFKGKCVKEFIQFIEFENIEEYFEDDFYEFKEKFDIL